MNSIKEAKFIKDIHDAINKPHTTDALLAHLAGIIDQVFPFKRTIVFYRDRVGDIFNPFSHQVEDRKSVV